ncbi:hypothetical protein [Consotaella aegiceratis]|uniref:hypothetical protein n=1 Tax=Consotaella aegiceratis TaxID=3097961 RepID=UPI002F3FCCDA
MKTLVYVTLAAGLALTSPALSQSRVPTSDQHVTEQFVAEKPAPQPKQTCRTERTEKVVNGKKTVTTKKICEDTKSTSKPKR